MVKNLDKIAGISKATVISNLGYTSVRIDHLFTGNLNAVIIEIVNWCAMCHLLKITAKITARQHIITLPLELNTVVNSD